MAITIWHTNLTPSMLFHLYQVSDYQIEDYDTIFHGNT